MSSVATRLGFGGSGIGNHRVMIDDALADELLDEAWDAGVRLYDTAPHYGLGLSETRLGAFLSRRPRGDVRVSTKVGRLLEPVTSGAGLDDQGFLVPAAFRRVADFSEAGVVSSLEASMDRLGVSHVDTVYVHDPEQVDAHAALETALPALHRLKQQGLVGRVGVGSMDHDALVVAAASGMVDELMVAGRLTLLDQESTADLLPLCDAEGVQVVAAAVFNGGLLTGPPTEGSTYDYRRAPSEIVKRARALDRTCREHGVPLAAAALQFPLRHPSVTTVVVGATAPGQTRANIALLDTPIPDDLWPRLDDLVGVRR